MDNLVFHPDRPEILAVLGWKLSTLGDPISDLANNCMAYFLPPHFNALRGTERGKVTFDTRRGTRVQKQISSCSESSADSWAHCRWKGLWVSYHIACSALSPLPEELFIPPGWKHLSACAVITVAWLPHPQFVSYLPPIWQILCHVLPVLVGTVTLFMHMDLC